MNTPKKWIFLSCGMVLTGIAALGIFLPLLPTTPILLLAAACFANSSERCHRWLVEHRLFGPVIRNWHEHRCIPPRARLIAILSIILFGGYSIGYAIRNPWVRGIGILLLTIGLFSVLRIPTCKKDKPE